MAAFMARAQGRVGPAQPVADAPAPPARRASLPAAVAAPLGEAREKFIPLTRHALIDRLAAPNLWGQGEAAEARRFFRYLAYWRQQSYSARLQALDQAPRVDEEAVRERRCCLSCGRTERRDEFAERGIGSFPEIEGEWRLFVVKPQ